MRHAGGVWWGVMSRRWGRGGRMAEAGMSAHRAAFVLLLVVVLSAPGLAVEQCGGGDCELAGPAEEVHTNPQDGLHGDSEPFVSSGELQEGESNEELKAGRTEDGGAEGGSGRATRSALPFRQLTDSTFCPLMEWREEGREKPTRWIILFYAPWCKHCRAVEPVFEEMCEALAGDHEQIRIGRVNVDENKPLRKRFRVKSLPTILVLENGCNGTVYYYPDQQERSLEALSDFARGGYRDVAGAPCPPPYVKRGNRTWFEEVVRGFRKYFEATEKHRLEMGVTHACCFGAGLLIGSVFVALLWCTQSTTPAQVSKKAKSE